MSRIKQILHIKFAVQTNYEMKIQNMKTSELAEWLHDNYERIAKKQKWNTQEKCQTKFNDLPEENRKTMLSMARKIHKNLGSQFD